MLQRLDLSSEQTLRQFRCIMEKRCKVEGLSGIQDIHFLPSALNAFFRSNYSFFFFFSFFVSEIIVEVGQDGIYVIVTTKKIFLSSKDKSNFYLEVRVAKSLRNLYVIFLQYITVKIQSITVKICAIINKKITHCCGQNTPINPKINAPSPLHLSVTDKSQGSFEPGTASLRGKALD